MIPIERLTPEQLVERYWQPHPKQSEFYGSEPLVVSPKLYAEIEREVQSFTKRNGWPDGAHGVQPDGRWNFIHSHAGNRHERRAAAARKRRAK